MPAVNDQAQLVGDFKERYAPKWKTLFEQASPLSSEFKFMSGQAVGNKYHQPVDVANEQGFSAAAPGVLPSANAYLLPVAGQSQDAQVEPYQLHGRARVAYTAEYRSDSEAKAFLDSNKIVMKRLTLGAAKRHEWCILNGQEGWAQSNGATIATGATRTFVASEASWATGAFIGSIGMPVAIFLDSAGAPSGSNLFVGRTNNNDAPTISGINYTTRTLTISCPNATDNALALASTYWIFPETHSAATEFPGLGRISSNTGTLFNINAATYPEWAGNVLSSVGVVDFAKVLEAHGVMAPWFPQLNTDTLTIMPPKAFEVLNTDQAALRQYDVSFSQKSKNGFRELSFATQVGNTRIIAHPMCRDSRMHIVVPDEIIRIGSTEHTFITRKNGAEVMVVESSDSPSGEMRDLIELALFAEAPRHTLIGTGLTY